MAIDARKHNAFAATEQPTMAGFNALSLSINDVMPCTNTTTQASQAAAVSAAGVSFSTNPLVTIRANAPGLHRIEYTYDGTNFLPASSVLHFSSTSAMNTFATANAALLTFGDSAWVGSALYQWNGSAFVAYDSGWIALTYSSGFGANSFGFSPAIRVVDNRCTLRGTVLKTSGSLSGGDQPVATFSASLRPAAVTYSVQQGGGQAVVNMQLDQNGVLTCKSSPTATSSWVSLDGFTWTTD